MCLNYHNSVICLDYHIVHKLVLLKDVCTTNCEIRTATRQLVVRPIWPDPVFISSYIFWLLPHQLTNFFYQAYHLMEQNSFAFECDMVCMERWHQHYITVFSEKVNVSLFIDYFGSMFFGHLTINIRIRCLERWVPIIFFFHWL